MKVPQYADALAGMQTAIERLFAGRPVERILEAGCGSTSQIRMYPGARLTGIDISAKQLARNELLDEKILGDIQTFSLPETLFDIVVCWDVLEHLPRPEEALAHFLHTTKPGGLILLAFPNLCSAKGLLTKFTPFRFHVCVRRHVFGERNAGSEDAGPFPTFLRRSITPTAIRQFATDNGLIVEFFILYESRMHRHFKDRRRMLAMIWTGVSLLAQVLTNGRIHAALTDVIVLLKKPEGEVSMHRTQ